MSETTVGAGAPTGVVEEFAALVGGSTPARMKFKNGDVSLDEAVAFVKRREAEGEKFTPPNVDLLVQAVMDTPW